MKVLIVAWSIFDTKLMQFSKNLTGGGIVIRNICEYKYIGKKEEVFLMLGNFLLPTLKLGNVTIIKTIPDNNYEFGKTENEKQKK